MSTNTETTTLAGGCFWCLEAVFKELRGVTRAESGYSGGHDPKPTYRAVCSGSTGHAEVVQVEFEPDVISFEDLLDVFFTIHDPTTLNRQGADVGTQYRSAVFYHSPDQKRVAEEKIAQLQRDGTWSGIVTEVVPLTQFFPAEDYHRDYYERNPDQPYCSIVIAPKVAKARKKFLEKLRAS